MKASKLRQRITIQSATVARSPTGSSSQTVYTDSATVWANIEPLSVKDVINAKAAGSRARLRCIIRYRQGINSSMRVLYDGKTYKIDGDPLADQNSGREYLTLILENI